MTLLEINQLVKSEIPAQLRQIYRAVNRAIRRINSAFIGYQSTEEPVSIDVIETGLTLSFTTGVKSIVDDGGGNFVTMGFAAGQKIWFAGTGALNVTEMTIVSISDDAFTNDKIVVSEDIDTDLHIAGTLSGFTVDSDYTWDYVNKELTLPTYVREINEVYVNEEKLLPRDLEYISNTDYNDELVYSPISDNVIKLPSWLMDTEDDNMSIEIMRNLAVITSDSDSTDVGIRTRMENMFIAAVFFDLYSSPEFKDTDLATINFNDFNQSVANYNQEEIRRLPTKLRELRYKY